MMSTVHRFSRLQELIGIVMALLLPAYAWSLDPSSNPKTYVVQAWNTENGLPQNSVHAMLQTSDGYLWMATENGLARFNGYQYRVFDKDSNPRLPGADLRCLFEDSHHALWIGTSSGLARMQNGFLQSYTTLDGLPSNSIRSILQSNDGTLWVLTSTGLASLADRDASSPATIKFRREFSGGLAGLRQSIAKSPDGGVWAATDHGILRLVRGRAPVALTGTSDLPVQALTCDETNRCVFASEDGVYQWKQGLLTKLAGHEALPAGGVHSLVATPSAIWAAGDTSVLLLQSHVTTVFRTGAQLPGQQIESLFVDRRGAAWIGTNDGIARWWAGQVTTAAIGSATAVLSFLEDSNGDLWLGTETTGAFELRDRPFSLIGKAQGIGDGQATSLAAGLASNLWVGTSAGGASLIDLQALSHHTIGLKQGLGSDTVLALATNPKDHSEAWIGTPDGLGHLQNNRISTYSTKDGLADDFVRSLLVARDGATWVGTRHGVTRWLNGRATTWTTEQGLGSDLVGAMVEDRQGDVWIGTLHGLARFSHGAIHNYTVADGLTSNTITALQESTTGHIWVGTNGGGLAVWNGEHFSAYSSVPTLPKALFAILEDGAGFLWLSSEHGLDRVAILQLAAYRSGSNHPLNVTHYGTADGLGSSGGSDAGHPSALQMEDGRLYFATRKGVVIVEPALLPSDDSPLPIVMEQITADDHDVTPEELASLPPGVSHLAISFAAIHLSAPQRIQYRYRLQGFDRDWVEVGTRRTAFYTNLPPGNYRFQINARSGSGPWSAAGFSMIAVGLKPQFYQTWWFKSLLLCTFALALLGLYQLRLRTLNARFEAVASERSRLAREIHDTLAQGFVAISVRLDLLSRMLHQDRLEQCRRELDETRSLAHDGLEEARRSIWNLRAEASERVTLPAKLDGIVKNAIQQGTDAVLEVTGAYHDFPPPVEGELIRMVQEAVANALRHGEPSMIHIRLVYTREKLRLEVRDDGVGFHVATAPAKESGHYGLTGLRERAEHIGAKLIIQSAPQSGTTVRIDIPTEAKRYRTSRA